MKIETYYSFHLNKTLTIYKMKSVVIYTYFSSPSSDYNLEFFIKKELSLKDTIDYIFVINGHTHPKTIRFPTLDNVTVLKRDNMGYDFGGHAHALEYLETTSKVYDYYFFMNSGVIGPILPHYFKGHWSSIFIEKITEKVKLVGTTIACLQPHDKGGYGPKVEGFFFMVDQVGLNVLKERGTIFCNHQDKISAVINGEYALSNCMFENGYSIDCMLPRYKGIDWTNPVYYTLNNNLHPSRKNTFYGRSINPYDVVFHKWYWHHYDNVNLEVIQQYAEEYISIKFI